MGITKYAADALGTFICTVATYTCNTPSWSINFFKTVFNHHRRLKHLIKCHFYCLGDVVYAQLPEPGSTVTAGKVCVVLYIAIGGRILQPNL